MITYIVTAFSFLAANFGWFGGAPQTEIFFWSDLIVTGVVIVICGIALFVMGSGGGRLADVLFGGAISLLAIVFSVIGPLLCILAAWICTFLWEIDFFLAYQVMAIGAATAQLVTARSSD